jgi:MFS family permease
MKKLGQDHFFPRKVHKLSWITLFLTWIVWAFNALDFQLLFALMPAMLSEFSVNPVVLGWCLAMFMFLRVLFDIPVGIYSDKFGTGWRRKTVWTPIVVVYSLVSFLTGFKTLSSNFTSYFVMRSFVQIGGSACETIGVTSTAEWWSKQHRGFSVGLHHTGFPIGGFIAGLLATFVLSTFGDVNWRYAFFFTLLAIPFMWAYHRISTAKNLSTVYKHIDDNQLTKPIETGTGEKISAKGWFEAIKNREVLINGIFGGIFMAVWMLFVTYYGAYLVFVGGYTLPQAASLAFVWTISGALFQVLIPRWSDFIGRRKLLIFAGFYAGVLMLLLPYATTILMVIVIQVFYGVVSNSVYPMIFAVAADAAPNGRVATSVSMITAMLWVGAGLASIAGGYIISLGGGMNVISGYHTVFIVMAVLSFLAGILQIFSREKAITQETVVTKADTGLEA